MPVREQQKLLTRERMLDAAVRVFRERGYADATIDDIVAAAAVGRATFYLHFKSKHDVMRALILSEEEENERLVAELRRIEKPTRAALNDWLRRFVGHWVSEGDRFLVGLQALASEPDLSNEVEFGLRSAGEALADLMARHGKYRANEAAFRAELLVGALQQSCRALVSNPDQYDVELVIRVIEEVWAANLLK